MSSIIISPRRWHNSPTPALPRTLAVDNNVIYGEATARVRCGKGVPTGTAWTPLLVLHSDFFQTAAGDPVYLECADNYYDMRERFAAWRPRLRRDLGLPAEAVLTCGLDWGIFSQEVFVRAVAAPDYHLITWEKNYRSGQWDPPKRAGQSVLEWTRKDAQENCGYCFEYLDEDWAKNPQRRQLIVRANNSRGRSVEVGVRHLP
ncbi:MAG: hypothetical protein WCK27_05410 [Verrucomicrobiota bacterium]